ncbi:hypothetical protein SCHPADRAFT_732269 [Schizopora paradoxa]|uniref:Uncharacterized protein n=1 Tax=Schizopora paradoxa TaxID=27342 RepID=A0A0H2R6V5_9AGAM|nr:hypothetical protein SCHPADRAFT_732269 [Schizopora paradoxa]
MRTYCTITTLRSALCCVTPIQRSSRSSSWLVTRSVVQFGLVFSGYTHNPGSGRAQLPKQRVGERNLDTRRETAGGVPARQVKAR